MDEKKYQVFVSSTYIDLLGARKKIIETVLSLYHFPVGMEMFSADDSEQWDIIKETIEGSDYYVIIIGHKYGSVAPSGLSYTEMEYDYAKSLGIPVLAFIRERNVGTLPNERESDSAKSEKLDIFIEKAKANKMCDFWVTIDDLATKVAIALPKIMRRTPRVGWVRGDQVTSKEVSSELAELSTENRNLRERLRDYESQLDAESPVLKLLMIEQDLNLTIPEYYSSQPYVNPFSRGDIPSDYEGLISDDEIIDYNNKIPPNEKVDNYNRRVFLNKCYYECSLKLSPILSNLGRKVATDIHIHIELPDFLVALNDDNETIFTSQPVIDIPSTPVEILKRKMAAQKTITSFRQALATGAYKKDSFPEIFFPENQLTNYINKVRPLNATDWVEYTEKNVVLRAKKLIQSLSIEFDEVVFIPINTGEGFINFKIVCEQLREPIIFSRKVVVSSGG